jgi:proline iminopeptidase
MSKFLSTSLIILAVAAVLVVLYLLLTRPSIQHWGATPEEVSRIMPGDDLVPRPLTGYTYAITIHAPPEKVWPWLAQVGFQRAGWYSYDFIYKLVGAYDFVDGHSANRIIPELQDLKVGDSIKIYAQAPFKVAALEPNRLLYLQARVNFGTMGEFGENDPLPEQFMRISWVYQLDPIDAQTTRLIVRWRQDYNPSFMTHVAYGGVLAPGSFIMQTKMLRGLRERTVGSRQ